VTSNVTAMPEIAGDAALLVDPTCVEEIAQAIERIVQDEALRQRLREKGLQRAAMFSWTRACARVRQGLRTLSDRPGEEIEPLKRTA
jgi:glycosyltransferase involved in cell wall biosynthesis